MEDKSRSIVITGLGILSPLGEGVEEYWENLEKRISPLNQIDIFPTREFKCKKAFQLRDFDFNRYFPGMKSGYIPRSTKMLLVSVKKALEDSGLNGRVFYKNDDWGVFTSTIYGSWKATYRFYKDILLKGPQGTDPMAFPPALINYSSSFLCITYGFKGPNITFSGGYHSGLEAVDYASNLIKQGLVKIAAVNGLNDLGSDNYAHLSLKGYLCSPRKESGYKLNIFDSKRDGFLVGENASTVILEGFDTALKRKSKIYAQIYGYGTNFGKTSDHYAKAMLNAIYDSGLEPKDIQVCFLNASGIKSLDSKELAALKKVFKDKINNIMFVALKENNGECEGASAVMQLVAAAKAMSVSEIPVSAAKYDAMPLVNGLNFVRKPKRTLISNILVNAFNLEGNNCSLVLKNRQS